MYRPGRSLLKSGEQMLYPGEKVGYLSHGDTQTVSLVPQYLFRQFGNLSKKEADKKSGRFMNFCSYLTDEFEMASVPSKTFLETDLIFYLSMGSLCTFCMINY